MEVPPGSAVIYLLRHLPSLQNRQGHGGYNTPLAECSEEREKLLAFIHSLGTIDLLVSGTLDRHLGTTNAIIEDIHYEGTTLFDNRLNAVLNSPLTEKSAEETTKRFHLDRFAPDADGVYRREGIAFDPGEMGIFPFDPLYCRAYLSRQLREEVFPDEQTLPSFDTLTFKTREVYSRLIEAVKRFQSNPPMVILSVGSCSSNALLIEYATQRTIGEIIVQPDGDGIFRPGIVYGDPALIPPSVPRNPLFPQQHGQVSALAILPTLGDASPVYANIDIDYLLGNHNGPSVH
ncbi:hypothetical protein J4460_03240 [Candidatus Woesearchaeota archaeon]|nr:MAG: hypothetical protein QS99_C0008G0018 [archaeon GW2011_AR4]MBS3129662.1 hypothetical protein [Candidatus Woesearchaeota archaeon]HIH38766.1 hypothetical protein [Candidatus Woesearchaeota archaeon]HIH49182.1 hypothetical protein [Candidatus Woesearchaeota archaeon]HIJ03324.1 hypothetical protein [Candidatus Woesearchaeota archaeon]